MGRKDDQQQEPDDDDRAWNPDDDFGRPSDPTDPSTDDGDAPQPDLTSLGVTVRPDEERLWAGRSDGPSWSIT
ncbi:hypothetical protein WEB32_22900 [Streptomyces netropsis]|uniref:Uncharacterized protein n=1 Tax=Streptomyces netropsis TaxID=55404 RepID=A0A7W7LA46_STRNE|nr:hypothetical protein [Streptomyces netropsis]MBB4885868.1 hypothetical protein [Streptomyces netropsis]GGR18143.1 hypothetical protein GCM10010219_24250 [Streptomyces netropsis]